MIGVEASTPEGITLEAIVVAVFGAGVVIVNWLSTRAAKKSVREEFEGAFDARGQHLDAVKDHLAQVEERADDQETRIRLLENQVGTLTKRLEKAHLDVEEARSSVDGLEQSLAKLLARERALAQLLREILDVTPSVPPAMRTRAEVLLAEVDKDFQWSS